MARSKGVLRQLSASDQNPKPARRGPKPKLIQDRELKPDDMKPIQRLQHSWSQRQKIRVLVFLYHHRIPIISDEPSQYRPPTQEEASEIFGVPQTTISRWVRDQNRIEQHGASSTIRRPRTVSICQWPELEEQLYQLFLKCRGAGQAIRRSWFRIQGIQIFQDLYPNVSVSVFRFSNGWFQRFLRRFRVSIRCVTKKAQKVPADYHNLVINWIRFNRRNSHPQPDLESPAVIWAEVVLCRAVGRYDLSNICNLDETPLPFEYLNGRTYDPIGGKTVWVKETRSGWDKRQASLVLCIFADGFNRIPPMIIFHGKSDKCLHKELKDYHPGVIVEFNETAYMNDQLFLKYLELYLIPALDGRPSLFALDLCSSHKTPAVLDTLRKHNVMPSLIPAGCTGLLQPLDVSINKPLKEYIRTLTDEAIFECENADDFEKWTVGQRRIMTTWCVGDAWYQFCIEKKEIISQVFRKVGLSLPIDGSADCELDIKGFDEIEVGDWSQDLKIAEDQFADVATENDNHELIEFVAHYE